MGTLNAHDESTGPVPGAEPELEVGSTLGAYRVLAPLSEGGTARVFLAEDAHGTRVALKVRRLFGTDPDPPFLRRFKREGEILERLQHRAIVRLLERGVDLDAGMAFLALEFVPGADLRQLLRERPDNRLEVPEAVMLLRDCAEALAFAHAQGVIHRDVKASNVLVTLDGQVKLADFGSALPALDSSRLTAWNEFLATPHYVAPEVLHSSDWSPAADLYALGALAYRALSGAFLFDYSSVRQILRAHIEEPPPPLDPSLEIPEALIQLVDDLLAKDPDDRPDALSITRRLASLTGSQRLKIEDLEPSDELVALPRAPTPATAHWDDGSDSDARPIRRTGAFKVFDSSESRPLPGSMGPGAKIGPYRVLRRLGQSPMSEVFLARHDELDQDHVLKLLAPELVERVDAQKRFARERNALTLMDAHPGIVRLQGAGTAPTGQPYYAMDYVPGESLHHHFKLGVPRARLLAIVEHIAEALAFAHDHHLLHRDVKPENIQILPEGRPCLIDFGLAKAEYDRERLTRTGEVMGTPAYMAPEQADRHLGDVGPWTDVYGLGAVLYEGLTGFPPFLGESFEVYTKLLQGTPITRPSAHDPTIPPALEDVVVRALARSPVDRYPHARAFLHDLRRARAQLRPRRLSRRRALMAFAAAALVLAALSPWASDVVRSTRRLDDLERSERLAETGDFTRALEIAQEVAHADDTDPNDRSRAIRQVDSLRRRRIASLLEQGDVHTARVLLDAFDGFVPCARNVLALCGDYSVILNLELDDPWTAQIASWAGDQRAFLRAIEHLDPDRARALSWRALPFLPNLRPTPQPYDPLRRGWHAMAQAEQALASGHLDICATLLHPLSTDPDLASDAWELRVRLELARGRLELAQRALLRAAEAPHSHLQRGYFAAWAAYLTQIAGTPGPLRDRWGESPLLAAKRLAPGLPWTRLSHRNRQLQRALAEDLPSAEVQPSHGTWDALTTRDAVRAGDLDPTSLCAWEHEILALGRDGPAGVFLRRALNLVDATERGGSWLHARDAIDQLELALEARPGSPLGWCGLARAALVLHDLPLARASLARARACAPHDPWVDTVAARLAAAEIEAEHVEARLEDRPPDVPPAALSALSRASPDLPEGASLLTWGRALCSSSDPDLDPPTPPLALERLRAARAAFAEATLRGDLTAQATVAITLRDLLDQLDGPQRQTLEVRAADGDLDAARALLTWDGDLPALALRSLHAAVPTPVGRRQALTEARRLAPMLPHVRFLEATRPFGDDPHWPARLDALADALTAQPGWFLWTLRWLRAHPTDLALLRDDPPTSPLGLALGLVSAPPRGPLDAAALLEATALARDAALTHPSAGAFLVWWHTLDRLQRSPLGGGVDLDPELRAALTGAEACDPSTPLPALARLHRPSPDTGAQLDAFLSAGFLLNAHRAFHDLDGDAARPDIRHDLDTALRPVSVHLNQLDLSDPSYTLGVVRLLEQQGRFPHLSLSLRLHLLSVAPELDAPNGWPGLLSRLPPLDRALRWGAESARYGAAQPDHPAAWRAAERALLVTRPAGLPPHRLGPSLLPGGRRLALWRTELPAADWPSHEYLAGWTGIQARRGLAAARLLAERQTHGPPPLSVDGLTRRRGRGRTLIHAAIDTPTQTAAAGWLAEAGDWGEVALAVERASYATWSLDPAFARRLALREVARALHDGAPDAAVGWSYLTQSASMLRHPEADALMIEGSLEAAAIAARPPTDLERQRILDRLDRATDADEAPWCAPWRHLRLALLDHDPATCARRGSELLELWSRLDPLQDLALRERVGRPRWLRQLARHGDAEWAKRLSQRATTGR